MGKFCLYADSSLDAPCVTISMRKYSYLKNFLENNAQPHSSRYSVPAKIDCIDIKEKNIQKPKCISCMYCVFGCIGNRILLSKSYVPDKMCVDITPEQIQELHKTFFPILFKGTFINLPQVPLSHLKVSYRSFCDFTSVKETENIAVWSANTLKYLSRSLEPRVALEVGVNIRERDRSGRLDIALMNINDNYLFVAETKVSFEKMIKENRYETQMMAYETVLQEECKSSIKRCKFLLIGGNESDLLPYKQEYCTSSRELNTKFYDTLTSLKLFFISANALLSMGLLKLFVSQENYCLENLYKYITDDSYVGLLSSGLITKEGEVVPFIP